MNGYKVPDGSGQVRALLLEVGVCALIAGLLYVTGVASSATAFGAFAGAALYFYGIFTGVRGGYARGYERGQDDTVARFL